MEARLLRSGTIEISGREGQVIERIDASEIIWPTADNSFTPLVTLKWYLDERDPWNRTAHDRANGNPSLVRRRNQFLYSVIALAPARSALGDQLHPVREGTVNFWNEAENIVGEVVRSGKVLARVTFPSTSVKPKDPRLGVLTTEHTITADGLTVLLHVHESGSGTAHVIATHKKGRATAEMLERLFRAWHGFQQSKGPAPGSGAQARDDFTAWFLAGLGDARRDELVLLLPGARATTTTKREYTIEEGGVEVLLSVRASGGGTVWVRSNSRGLARASRLEQAMGTWPGRGESYGRSNDYRMHFTSGLEGAAERIRSVLGSTGRLAVEIHAVAPDLWRASVYTPAGATYRADYAPASAKDGADPETGAPTEAMVLADFRRKRSDFDLVK
jgi:hypothetical protein